MKSESLELPWRQDRPTLEGLALTLHGPMQAWGGPIVGDNRPTNAFPTRSGVLGLVAACVGIRRTEHQRLFALAEGARVHVRVEAAGSPMVDDQTIQDNPRASELRQTIQSKRTYLCDAHFVAVIVPGPHFSVKDLAEAIATPVFAPFLGRRCCVPSTPLLLAASVTGSEPLGLFESLPRAAPTLGPGPAPRRGPNSLKVSEFIDYYLDVDDYPSSSGGGGTHAWQHQLRRLRLRDDLAGPLPRQWRERWVVHVRQTHASSRAGSDPIDDWMPQ